MLWHALAIPLKGNFCYQRKVIQSKVQSRVSKYLLFFLMAFCLLAGQASAVSECDMPVSCCAGSVGSADLECGCAACSCFLREEASGQDDPQSLLTLHRVELEAREIVLFVLPDTEFDSTERGSFGPLQNDPSWDRFFLSQDSFPNPPPAAA
jgi:hypothetical protein